VYNFSKSPAVQKASVFNRKNVYFVMSGLTSWTTPCPPEVRGSFAMCAGKGGQWEKNWESKAYLIREAT